jgi:hypothetical protein
MNKLLPFMGVLSGLNEFYGNSKKEDELKDIDIEKEYYKIQQKKSNLSRRLRNEVIFRYSRKQKEQTEP